MFDVFILCSTAVSKQEGCTKIASRTKFVVQHLAASFKQSVIHVSYFVFSPGM